VTAAAALENGARVDEFEIIERIGYGAFSDVYRARDGTGRDVVLKCPREVLLGDTATFDRFRREMRIADQLDHPGIQRSLDVHAHRSRPYLVMEYVEGRSLRDVLGEEGPFTVERATAITIQLASAMAHAHGRGVCHRDLKPENLLIGRADRAVVTDFGIALMQGARRLTYRWFSPEMGTPDYMAPEQIQLKRGDRRTDVYAIGVVLYEMLCGRVPWSGNDALAVMSQKLTGRPADLDRVAPAVPLALRLIVRKCIRRNPDERYQTADDLVQDLEGWRHLDPSGFSFPPEKALRGGSKAGLWFLVAGISLGFLLLSAGAVFLFHLVATAHH
jgi:eukaryotic-like serine/threonine-protein kinase